MSDFQMEKLNPYSARVDREHPMAFVFLIDRSGSMTNMLNFNGEYLSKDHVVANAMNKTIEEIINRCTKSDEMRHYFDISLIGYGCGQKAQFITINGQTSKTWYTPEELKQHSNHREVHQTVNIRGVERDIVINEPYWLEPVSNYQTPMHNAFELAYEILNEWCKRHQSDDCFPPIVINITDGCQTDATNDQMIEIANKLKSLCTSDGNLLLFNIHLSSDNTSYSISFPTHINNVGGNTYSRMLYEMSSTLPTCYNKDISTMKGCTGSEYRAMGLNTRADFVQMLNIGTITNLSSDE